MPYPLNMLSHLTLKIHWCIPHYIIIFFTTEQIVSLLSSLLSFLFPSLPPFLPSLPFGFQDKTIVSAPQRVGGVRWGIYVLTSICILNVNCGQVNLAHP